uniref:Myb-like domain-containing protein n=1 Tax=Rhizophora mucronata TaxID=61149 RepID=A0A2P2JKE7_RHIMU
MSMTGAGSASPPPDSALHNQLPDVSAPPQPPTNRRRLPPPCWSHEETIALIDAYRDKWYTLRRGNLKANHWQEVADAVGRRCPDASPQKTAVQCRHKMEKLRKRYRSEIQRARSMPVSRFTSSWVHFKRMDAMEKGPQAKDDYNSESDGGGGGEDDNDDEKDNEDDNQGFYVENYKNGATPMNTRSIHKLYRNGIGNSGSSVSASGSAAAGAGGFRIRIPTGVSIAQPGHSFYGKIDSKYAVKASSSNFNPKPIYGSASSLGLGSSKVVRGNEEIGKKREREPMEEMVGAIKVLGDGFVRMEQMKMEMAREIETMKMEMEMKRTEMILESHQWIVEAFAKAFSEKKNKKKQQQQQQQANSRVSQES